MDIPQFIQPASHGWVLSCFPCFAIINSATVIQNLFLCWVVLVEIHVHKQLLGVELLGPRAHAYAVLLAPSNFLHWGIAWHSAPPTLVWETVGSPKFNWLLCCCDLLRWKCRLYHQTSGFKLWFRYKMLWGHWANCLTTQFRQTTPTPLQLSRVMAASAPTAAWASLHSHLPSWRQPPMGSRPSFLGTPPHVLKCENSSHPYCLRFFKS